MKLFLYCCLILLPAISKAEQYQKADKTLEEKISDFFKSDHNEQYQTINFQKLSNLRFDQSKLKYNEYLNGLSYASSSILDLRKDKVDLSDAVKIAIQRSPDISQSIATLAGQNSGVDVAKAGYYPQLAGGVSTGDLTTGERGRQLLTLTVTQMLFDFGKIKSGVSVEQAKVQVEQANVLVSVDTLALD
ncbi:TolC family protein, partial [Acinetobacter seifertii]|uniref:TolC family protein n=1 Tax=Acinetobacter seifertii TaxID=1530123 RepID=UPI00280CE958